MPPSRRLHETGVTAPATAPTTPSWTIRSTAPSAACQLALFALAVGLAGFALLRAISPNDEGLMLQTGARIAAGQLPYRDFWTNYAPGQELMLAGLDKLFGVSLLSWRILALALDGTVSLLAYRLARRQAPAWLALLAWVAVAGAMAWPSGPGPNPPALALAFAALLAAPSRPLLAGALAGLAVFYRFEIGAAATLGVIIALPAGARARAALCAVAVAAALLAPFFAAAPAAMWHDTIGFLAIQDLQRLPFPLAFRGPLRPSKLIEFYFPLILVAGCALWLAAAVSARPLAGGGLSGGGLRGGGRPRGTLALVPLAVLGVGYLLGRTDEFHLLPLSAVLAIMLAGSAANERRRAVRVALLLALALIAVNGLERRAGQALHPPAAAAVPGPAGGGVQTSPADARALRRLRATVNALIAPGAPIFVANPRFDLVRVGDPLLYIILGHPNPTRYDVMQPGVVTTAPVQREIIRSLRRSRTRLVVRWLDPTADAREPNGSGRSSGVHILERYLAAHFRRYATYGYYEVLVPAGRGRSRRG